MVESTLSTPKCLVLSSNITSSLADNHHLIASVVVVLTPRTLPMSTQGMRFYRIDDHNFNTDILRLQHSVTNIDVKT